MQPAAVLTSPDLAPARLVAAIAARHGAFGEAAPWPHLMLDDVLDAGLVAAAADEARSLAASLAPTRSSNFYKAELAKADGPAISELHRILGSAEVTRELAALSGAADLRVDDESRACAGLYVNSAGSYHRPHYDFQHHPETGLWQRINVLVYLNDWPTERGGALELWQRPARDTQALSGDPIVVRPRAGRVLIMETSRRALHAVGAVTCAPDEARLTLSTRFYSKTAPEHAVTPLSKLTRPRLPSDPWWRTLPSGKDALQKLRG